MKGETPGSRSEEPGVLLWERMDLDKTHELPRRGQPRAEDKDDIMTLLYKIDSSLEKFTETWRSLKHLQALLGRPELESLLGVSCTSLDLRSEVQKTRELMMKVRKQEQLKKKTLKHFPRGAVCCTISLKPPPCYILLAQPGASLVSFCSVCPRCGGCWTESLSCMESEFGTDLSSHLDQPELLSSPQASDLSLENSQESLPLPPDSGSGWRARGPGFKFCLWCDGRAALVKALSTQCPGTCSKALGCGSDIGRPNSYEFLKSIIN
ncbi:centromere protein R [Trichosurus vulpecula]|uniref:centromere protein R n=1 Tax=Trichosurus vulpecula TaxID=9337 RepID=UPI00186AEB3C|nr:centromere protein R [Trichosurus vulpecula]